MDWIQFMICIESFRCSRFLQGSCYLRTCLFKKTMIYISLCTLPCDVTAVRFSEAMQNQEIWVAVVKWAESRCWGQLGSDTRKRHDIHGISSSFLRQHHIVIRRSTSFLDNWNKCIFDWWWFGITWALHGNVLGITLSLAYHKHSYSICLHLHRAGGQED